MNFFKNNKSSFLLLASMFIGGTAGYFWGEDSKILTPIADVFLHLLYCCVVPMIFVSLIASISGMQNLSRLGKVLGVMLGAFIAAEILASVYMVILCAVFDPAQGINIAMPEITEEFKGNRNFLAMFTVNDFPLLWSRRNLMALIVFTLMFGVALVSVGEKGRPVVKVFDALSAVVIKMVSYVMKIAPIGLGCFFAVLMGEYGKEIVGPLSRAIILYMVAAVVFYFGSNTLYAFMGGGSRGVKAFWNAILPPTITALGTCSSAATIPVNLVAAKRIGISDEIADLTIPMGANLHKDGACLIEILKIAFMCSIFNINFLDPKVIITAIMVSVLAATVMGAIPSGGYVAEILIISAFGFPPAAIPIMVLIGTITDSPATAINATGDTSIAMVVSRVVDGKDWMDKKVTV